MELYRLLRFSIYLTAASGALALAIAEGDLRYLLAMLGLSALSHFLIDSGRIRPVQIKYSAAMLLAILLYTFLSLRETEDWGKHFPQSAAHCICIFQILLFFTDYHESILLTYCGSSLLVVLISGIIHPGISLIFRMSLFIGLTTWTLFIHSLWRSRENYKRADSVTLDKTIRHEEQSLDPHALKQGLGLVAGLALGCLLLGSFFFVFAPRVNETLTSIIDDWTINRNAASGIGPGTGGRRNTTQPNNSNIENPFAPTPNSVGMSKGWCESVNYKQQGPIVEDRRTAYALYIRSLAPGLASPSGRVYLRGLALSDHHSPGGWLPDRTSQASLEGGPDGIDLSVDPSNAVAPSTSQIQLIVSQKVALSKVFFTVGSITRLKSASSLLEVQQDKEGSLWKTNNIDHYEMTCHLPIFPENVPDNAVADHPDQNRYVRNHGLSGDYEVIKRLAQSIVLKAHAETSLQKVLAIQKFLQDTEVFSYTLKLEDYSLRQFLLEEGKHRGHCGYYSTAFVLLCRMNNIPARIATGFATDLTPKKLQSDELTIEFQNSDAHAWGEVFFKNTGWVTFDPTPASFIHTAQESFEVSNTDKEQAVKALAPAETERGLLSKAWNHVLRYNSNDQRNLFSRITTSVGASWGGAKNALLGQSNGGWILALLIWLLVGALIYFVLIALFKRGRRRASGHALNTARARAAVSFYNDLLLVLSRRGFVRRAGQTPREFAEQVVHRGGVPFQPVWVVTQVFEQVRYGNVEISQEDFNALQHALDTLRELTFVSATPMARN